MAPRKIPKTDSVTRKVLRTDGRADLMATIPVNSEPGTRSIEITHADFLRLIVLLPSTSWARKNEGGFGNLCSAHAVPGSSCEPVTRYTARRPDAVHQAVSIFREGQPQ